MNLRSLQPALAATHPGQGQTFDDLYALDYGAYSTRPTLALKCYGQFGIKSVNATGGRTTLKTNPDRADRFVSAALPPERENR